MKSVVLIKVKLKKQLRRRKGESLKNGLVVPHARQKTTSQTYSRSPAPELYLQSISEKGIKYKRVKFDFAAPKNVGIVTHPAKSFDII